MPSAGLGEAALAVLRAAVEDSDVVTRFRGTIRYVEGSSRAWWSGAVSARGHGRFWIGSVGGQDVVVIAHRFSWALECGVDDLTTALVLEHPCDNPLCQRVGAGHVQRSSHAENRREWVVRRHTIGNPLRDDRGTRGRARALRDVLRSGRDSQTVRQSCRSRLAGRRGAATTLAR